MDRFSAYLLVRRFLKQRASRNRALAAEAIMEELSALAGRPEGWGVLGLLSQLDLEYAAHNPDARGATAREQAILEGMPPELADSLVRWRAPREDAGPPVEAALYLADHLAAAALETERSPEELDDDDPSAWLEPGPGADDDHERSEQPRPLPRFDAALQEKLGRELELRCQSGDAVGDRLAECLERLGLDSRRAAALATRGLSRVAEDLR